MGGAFGSRLFLMGERMAHYLLYFSPEEHFPAVDYMKRMRARGETIQGRNGKAFMKFGPSIEVEWVVDIAKNLGTILCSTPSRKVFEWYEHNLSQCDPTKIAARVEMVELGQLPQTPVEEVIAEAKAPLPDIRIDFDALPYAELREKTLELTGTKPKSKAACMAALDAKGLL